MNTIVMQLNLNLRTTPFHDALCLLVGVSPKYATEKLEREASG